MTNLGGVLLQWYVSSSFLPTSRKDSGLNSSSTLPGPGYEDSVAICFIGLASALQG